MTSHEAGRLKTANQSRSPVLEHSTVQALRKRSSMQHSDQQSPDSWKLRVSQQDSESTPTVETAADDEKVVYYSFVVDARLADALTADAEVDKVLADIERTCGCIIIVDQQNQKRRRHSSNVENCAVRVRVLMNEIGGNFRSSATRLSDLIGSLGGRWQVQRLVRRLSSPIDDKSGFSSSAWINRTVTGSNINTDEDCMNCSNCVNSPGSRGCSSNSSLVSSLTDERVDSGRWILNSSVSPFIRLRQVQQRLQMQQQQQQQQPESRAQTLPGPSLQFIRRLWRQAVRLLAEATRSATAEAAANELAYFSRTGKTNERHQQKQNKFSKPVLCAHNTSTKHPDAEHILLLSALTVDAEATNWNKAIDNEANSTDQLIIDDSSFSSTNCTLQKQLTASVSLGAALCGGQAHSCASASSARAGVKACAEFQVATSVTNFQSTASRRLAVLRTATSKQRSSQNNATVHSCLSSHASSASAVSHHLNSALEHQTSQLSTQAVCRAADGLDLAPESIKTLLTAPAKLAFGGSYELPASASASSCSFSRARSCSSKAESFRLASSHRERLQCAAHSRPAPPSAQSEIESSSAFCQVGSSEQVNSGQVHEVCHQMGVTHSAAEKLQSECSVQSVSLCYYQLSAHERAAALTLKLTALSDITATFPAVSVVRRKHDRHATPKRQPLLELNLHQPRSSQLLASCQVISIDRVQSSLQENGGKVAMATETTVSMASQCDECAHVQPAATVVSCSSSSGSRQARPEALAYTRGLQDGIVHDANTVQTLAEIIFEVAAAMELRLAWPSQTWRRPAASAELTACCAEARRHVIERTSDTVEKIDGSESVCIYSELVWQSRKSHQLAWTAL